MAANEKPKLYTCEIDEAGPKMHPCRRAHDALDGAGIDYATEVHDRNRPMGFGSKGKRPELKEISGQEKLPVLQLVDGSTVNGSGKIVKWAKQNAAAG